MPIAHISLRALQTAPSIRKFDSAWVNFRVNLGIMGHKKNINPELF